MIDNLQQVDRVMDRLKRALPVPAVAGQEFLASLQSTHPTTSFATKCVIEDVFYAGDEGGILCNVVFDGGGAEGEVYLVSITHLSFDPRLSVARAIAGYQKHRLKRLHGGGGADGM